MTAGAALKVRRCAARASWVHAHTRWSSIVGRSRPLPTIVDRPAVVGVHHEGARGATDAVRLRRHDGSFEHRWRRSPPAICARSHMSLLAIGWVCLEMDRRSMMLMAGLLRWEPRSPSPRPALPPDRIAPADRGATAYRAAGRCRCRGLHFPGRVDGPSREGPDPASGRCRAWQDDVFPPVVANTRRSPKRVPRRQLQSRPARTRPAHRAAGQPSRSARPAEALALAAGERAEARARVR